MHLDMQVRRVPQRGGVAGARPATRRTRAPPRRVQAAATRRRQVRTLYFVESVLMKYDHSIPIFIFSAHI